MARPMLTAMRSENTRGFKYNEELYSDLASLESPQHGKEAKMITNPRAYWSEHHHSEDDSPDFFLTPKRRRRALSISTHVAKLTRQLRE